MGWNRKRTREISNIDGLTHGSADGERAPTWRTIQFQIGALFFALQTVSGVVGAALVTLFQTSATLLFVCVLVFGFSRRNTSACRSQQLLCGPVSLFIFRRPGLAPRLS